MSAGSTDTFLRVTALTKVYKLDAGLFAAAGRWVWALNGVSIDVLRGETYGLVGESGSGKTTLAKALVQLFPHTSGRIEYFNGSERWEITRSDPRSLRRFRADVKYVFQDPASALDPRMNVLRILTAGSRYSNRSLDSARLVSRARETMEAVGLRAEDLQRRPSEFSGGQRQRISLARALISGPSVLICDEVVSALDVSVQGQILNLLIELKRKYQLTMIFIAHDLTVVSYMADRIGVLYGGKLMEEAPTAGIVERPLHPYTQLLYSAMPRLGGGLPERGSASGAPYNPTRPPSGCPFVGRCPLEQEKCRTVMPELREVRPGHR
ncbi:MAG TPA: ABC transporter ATP-binding protein, partial [Spirochaetia bacterium]|nr:ABC transporter ATP-binding protein [Spirochaetia bacterium]